MTIRRALSRTGRRPHPGSAQSDFVSERLREATSGSRRWACESPVSGWLRRLQVALGSAPGMVSVCEMSNTNVVLKNRRRSSLSSWSLVALLDGDRREDPHRGLALADAPRASSTCGTRRSGSRRSPARGIAPRRACSSCRVRVEHCAGVDPARPTVERAAPRGLFNRSRSARRRSSRSSVRAAATS